MIQESGPARRWALRRLPVIEVSAGKKIPPHEIRHGSVKESLQLYSTRDQSRSYLTNSKRNACVQQEAYHSVGWNIEVSFRVANDIHLIHGTKDDDVLWVKRGASVIGALHLFT